jgi:hypothetical protein
MHKMDGGMNPLALSLAGIRICEGGEKFFLRQTFGV